MPQPQTYDAQQNDKITSFLLAEVGKMMEKLERRVEAKLGSLTQQTQHQQTPQNYPHPHPLTQMQQNYMPPIQQITNCQ